MNVRISGIIEESIVDGEGIRFVVFTQGCPHNCYKCHNKKTHPINDGEVKTVAEILNKIKDNPLLDGITLSGGEPFLQVEPLIEIAKYCKNINLNVWVYSGYTFEEILNDPEKKELLYNIDILVDGKYIDSQKSYNLLFCGSKNQRIIDVKKSMSIGKPIIYMDNYIE